MSRRKGIFVMDAMVGLGLITLLAGMLAVGMNGYQTACRRLAQHRAAGRLAETALVNLQQGQPVPKPVDSLSKIQWRRIEGTAPAGMQWTEVDATVDRATETLMGLTPQGPAGGGQ